MTIADYKTSVRDILSAQKVTTSPTGKYAAHYTRFDTPRIVLASVDSNLMRQFDGDYMNDPEEGRYLVDVMIAAAQKCTHQHKELFTERLRELRASRLLYSAYKKSTFLSCWTVCDIKEDEKETSDSLNHWRFYGQDGAGSCIMIPLAHLIAIFPDMLYRVTYGTESRGGGSAAASRPVVQLRDSLTKRFNAIRKSRGNAMKELEEVIEATHPLLFLFKSSEYASELEVRSIIHKNGYAKSDGVLFDTREPKRAFIESNKGLIGSNSIIHYGPKSDHKLAIEAMGLAATLGLDISVYVSSKPYR